MQRTRLAHVLHARSRRCPARLGTRRPSDCGLLLRRRAGAGGEQELSARLHRVDGALLRRPGVRIVTASLWVGNEADLEGLLGGEVVGARSLIASRTTWTRVRVLLVGRWAIPVRASIVTLQTLQRW